MIARLLIAQWAAMLYVGAVSFAVSVFIARQIGPSAFGEYSVALSIGALLLIFLDGGMRSLLLRERVRVSPHLAHLFEQIPAIAFGHAMTVALVANLLVVTLFPNSLALGLATVWCFFGVALTQYISAILRGHGRLVLDAGWQVWHRTFSVMCIVPVIFMGFHSPWHILAAWALGTTTTSLIFSNSLKCRPRLLFQPELYKAVLPLLWIDLATAVYFRSDVMMLQWLGVPSDQIGQYAAAYRLIEAAIFLANPVAILLFRHMRKMNEDRHALGQYITRATVLAAILGITGATIIAAFADPVITLTYGSKYSEAAGLLAILAWMVVFVLPNAVLTQAAIALDLEWVYVLAASMAAICNVAMNFVFIAHYGPQAAAWATIVTEVVLMAILAFSLARRLKQPLAGAV